MRPYKPKYKLIGSAPTLEQLIKGIDKYYCGPTKLVILESGQVGVSDRILNGVRVICKSSRWRFEREIR